MDIDRRELSCGPNVLTVAPQVFDLLAHLIRHRERVVSKDELINVIWNGRTVSDAALTTRMNVVRNAIGDTGGEQRLIKTLPRKGFRFVGQVRETQVSKGKQLDGPIVQLRQKPANKPSIVVLPFTNLSSHPEQEYFVDGVTESLTTDLSRINGAFVIASNSAFTYRGRSIDVRQVGRELNVRYVLQGSVQRNSGRLRVNVQLVDAETGNQVWADRFDKPVIDLLDMQDEIVARLANALNAEFIEAEARRAERSKHLGAMDCYFQGMASLNRGQALENLTQAGNFFERALALDPGNTGALVGTALVNISIGGNFLTEDRSARFLAAESASIKALSLAPDFALAHLALGAARAFLKRAAEGIAEFERALELDRNLAEAHACIGWAKFLLGRGEDTEAHVHEAFRLSPRDISAFRWAMMVGIAKLQLNADAEAVFWLRKSIEANRNYPSAHFHLAAALALLGLLDEARAAAKLGLALNSHFSLRRFVANAPSTHPTFLAGARRIYQGMRMAGVPEG